MKPAQPWSGQNGISQPPPSARIRRPAVPKGPVKRPDRGRLWLNDGARIRLRPARRHHVRARDVVPDRTHAGRPLSDAPPGGRGGVDGYSRACPSVRVARPIKSEDVPARPGGLFVAPGPPGDIRSDNVPEFRAKAVWR